MIRPITLLNPHAELLAKWTTTLELMEAYQSLSECSDAYTTDHALPDLSTHDLIEQREYSCSAARVSPTTTVTGEWSVGVKTEKAHG